MQQPGMMTGAGGAEGILDEPGNCLEITQDNHWPKPCCICCIANDHFKAKTQLNSEVNEDADWINKNCIPFLCGCFQKATTYKLEVGNQQVINFTQGNALHVTNGSFADVSLSGRQIGKVGLPCTMFSMGRGLKNCAIDFATWGGGCFCNRMGFAACSQQCCICAGINILPTRVFDASGSHLYNVIAPCLQIGVILACLLCFDPCRTVEFNVEDPQGNPVTQIIRYNNAECLCLRPSNKFTVKYHNGASREHKALLFASAISLHYLYFDM